MQYFAKAKSGQEPVLKDHILRNNSSMSLMPMPLLCLPCNNLFINKFSFNICLTVKEFITMNVEKSWVHFVLFVSTTGLRKLDHIVSIKPKLKHHQLYM